MKVFSVPAGTIVRIESIPFRLVEKTVLEGHPVNVEMLTVEHSPYEPDTKTPRGGNEENK